MTGWQKTVKRTGGHQKNESEGSLLSNKNCWNVHQSQKEENEKMADLKFATPINDSITSSEGDWKGKKSKPFILQ